MNISPKTAAATGGSALGGSLAVIFIWLLTTIDPRLQVTDEVAAALTVVFGTVTAFVSSYATHSNYAAPPPAQPPSTPPPNQGA